MMRVRLWVGFIIAVILVFGTSIARADVTSAILKGNGAFQNGDKLTINANLKPDGKIRGSTKFKPADKFKPILKGNVVQVVPPPIGKKTWCVTSEITEGEFAGWNLVWLVENTGTGCDNVNGFLDHDADCSREFPDSTFRQIVDGDFKGKWRCGDKRCCPNN